MCRIFVFYFFRHSLYHYAGDEKYDILWCHATVGCVRLWLPQLTFLSVSPVLPRLDTSLSKQCKFTHLVADRESVLIIFTIVFKLFRKIDMVEPVSVAFNGKILHGILIQWQGSRISMLQKGKVQVLKAEYLVELT